MEEDHGQYVSFTMRLAELWQVHIKLMTTGRIEAEIEPPQDYPGAHLNPTHSYSAHQYLSALLPGLGVRFRCKRNIPATCLHPILISPQQPTHRNGIIGAGAILGLLDIALNDGNATRSATRVAFDKIAEIKTKKMERRKRLFKRMGWPLSPFFW